MELNHFSHIHPLVFNEDQPSDGSDKTNCSGCGELVSGPSFSCMACKFYLDKKCAEAPSELAHPFHRNHNFNLLTSNPSGVKCFCNFCNKICKNFVYHCSCELNLHIKCALFSYNIAENKIGELQIAHVDPLTSTAVPSEELKKAECFACWKPLLDCAHLSLDSGFCLHKKCVELPLQINHLCHRQHSLFLQFNSQRLPCQICQQTQRRGFVYCCSRCLIVLHIECVSPKPSALHIIEDSRRRHEHPFSRFFGLVSFICDACGTPGENVSYICSTCGLIVHKECISLPRVIKSIWHHHPTSHKYFVVDNECATDLECGICHEEVNRLHGSYYCSNCKFVLHVKCARMYWYDEIDESSKDANENEDQLLAANHPSFVDIGEMNLGEKVLSREIKHFSHEHNLVSSDEVKEDEIRSYCDGCSRLITTPFYHCNLQCDFFLHKSCAELPKKKLIWIHLHYQQPLDLVPNQIFICVACDFRRSGFAYRCEKCGTHYCVSCAKRSYSWRSQGHEHLLLIYTDFTAKEYCNACGGSVAGGFIFRCKACNFNVHGRCTLLPQRAVHKCDKHVLKLTYHESNDYSEHLYCDICEERREASTWFYHCTICNTSAHLDCALGDSDNRYRFIRRGIRTLLKADHPHTLVVVEKDYDYPEACCECGGPCLHLALQCSQTATGCNYIIHLGCSAQLSRLWGIILEVQ